jgi:hypothetical protein
VRGEERADESQTENGAVRMEVMNLVPNLRNMQITSCLAAAPAAKETITVDTNTNGGDIARLFQDITVTDVKKELSEQDQTNSDHTGATMPSSSTSSSSSDTTQHQHQKKELQFMLDAEGEPFCEYFEIEAWSDEEKPNVWWQPLDFKVFRRYCRRSADLARSSASFVNEFTRVYDACCTDHVDNLLEFSDISRSHVRGLEIVVFPALARARKLVVKGVVTAQYEIPEDMDLEKRAKVISATSRLLTGRARLLARVYGVGDEEVANDCYYSMGKDDEDKSNKR